MANVSLDLTRRFNRDGRTVILASGPAVVYYRIAMMSKDGDWIIREDGTACQLVLEVLCEKRASYRPGAPLDVRWLEAGWSSHFEFLDEASRRVRCDFFSRPPRIEAHALARMFEASGEMEGDLAVVDLESLILMKRTQRAKDYPVIAEIARRLRPELEIEFTTDPDRILELIAQGYSSSRPAVLDAINEGRAGLIAALATEIDEARRRDASRFRAYLSTAEPYLREFQRRRLGSLPLADAHPLVVQLAEEFLPESIVGGPDGQPE